MYLMHMLMLPAVFGLLSPLLPVPLTIILTAVVTYCLSFVISRLIGKLPFGKYIVGWKGYSRSWLTKYASSIARYLVALQDDGMEGYFPMQNITYFPRAAGGFLWSMIVNELSFLYVTIVTESAFFVTIVVTEPGPISKSLHWGD